jgi:hypothetical protein
VNFETELRQRFREQGAIVILAVDDQNVDAAKILNEMTGHLTNLRLVGRMPDELLTSSQTR